MSTPSSSTDQGTSAQQQVGAAPVAGPSTAPEAVWFPFVRHMYPNLETQRYFLPPLHFKKTCHDVTTIAGQKVRVLENPPVRPQKTQWQTTPVYPPPPQQVVGTVFTENPADLQPAHLQHSDIQGDEAEQRCLQALGNIPSEVMMIISQLHFRRYLDNRTNPLRTDPAHAAAIAKLPSIQHQSLPQDTADRECDILIIHRHKGLILGEVKAVGINQFFQDSPVAEQKQTIVRVVGKAINQLKEQTKALRHLVSDLPPIRVTGTLLLPNITYDQLRQAVDSSPSLTQALCQCMNTTDVNLAVDKCLCKDHMKQPSRWWQTLLSAGPDPHMTPTMYERMVARFCGPATTVEVATASPPRVVVRSPGQAVAETGLRFSRLALTPAQVDLLNRRPEPPGVFIQGPPGCGKTVVLVLKALQWAQQGRTVHIVSGHPDGHAVSLLVEQQLHSSLGAAGLASIRHHCYNFINNPDDVQRAVRELVALAPAGGDPLSLIMDEVAWGLGGKVFTELLPQLHRQVAAMTVWMAGVLRVDNDPSLLSPLPWVTVETLTVPLRCPPAVTREVKQSGYINNSIVPPYSDPGLPVETEGPSVRWLDHRRQSGHTGDYPLDCEACADLIGDFLMELRVGQPGHSLQFRDVWILSGVGPVPSSSDAMVQRLHQHHELPVRVVTLPLSQSDLQELALATTDQVIVTQYRAVRGLERRVVIGLVEDDDYERLLLMSRTTGVLCVIR